MREARRTAHRHGGAHRAGGRDARQHVERAIVGMNANMNTRNGPITPNVVLPDELEMVMGDAELGSMAEFVTVKRRHEAARLFRADARVRTRRRKSGDQRNAEPLEALVFEVARSEKRPAHGTPSTERRSSARQP